MKNMNILFVILAAVMASILARGAVQYTPKMRRQPTKPSAPAVMARMERRALVPARRSERMILVPKR